MSKKNSDSTVLERPAPTQEDIEAVCRRLGNLGYSLLALRRMVNVDEEDHNGFLRHGISELLRGEFKKLDACIERLGGMPIGNFSDEFEPDSTD